MKFNPRESKETAPTVISICQLLNEKQVSERYGLNVRSLQGWRHKGGGPEYVKISRRMVLYRPADVERWIDEHLTKHTAMPTKAELVERETNHRLGA